MFQSLCQFSSDFYRIHVEIFGSFRCCLKDSLFEGIFGNEFRDFDKYGKRNDVEGDEFALFVSNLLVKCRCGPENYGSEDYTLAAAA